MYKGQCLCGSVSWELLAEPYAIYNCHCRMCQKVHGAAFGTYCFVKNDEIRWTGSTDTVTHYRSSDVLQRSHCGRCGSVVPYPDNGGEFWVAPGGCHDTMRKPDYNIFVVDNSPWHTISGNLPEEDGYPGESGLPSVAGVAVPQKTDGRIQGSCLCGTVKYELTEDIAVAHNCHCSRCRHGRAAAHATNGFVSSTGVHYLEGEDNLDSYKVPDAKHYTQVFCRTCGSLMPRIDPSRDISVIPMSSLDHDTGIRPKDHIYVGSKCDWHDITDDLPQFEEGPVG